MSRLINLDSTLIGDKYVSEPLQLEGLNAAIQIKVSEQASFVVQRSISGYDFSDIPGMTISTADVSEVGITGGVTGQFLRVVCTKSPISIKALV